VLISNCLDTHYKDPVLGKQTKESLLKQQWSNLSNNAKQPFFSSIPKAPFDSIIESDRTKDHGKDNNNESASSNKENINAAENMFEISENFAVVVFIPHSVDYLNLKSKPQERCLYDIQHDWKEVFVNP
jgi:hypothetical protein